MTSGEKSWYSAVDRLQCSSIAGSSDNWQLTLFLSALQGCSGCKPVCRQEAVSCVSWLFCHAVRLKSRCWQADDLEESQHAKQTLMEGERQTREEGQWMNEWGGPCFFPHMLRLGLICLTGTFLCKNLTTTQSVEELMELLCQYFPTQDQQRRMSHFSLLRKSLCIIKMLPGNTPAVHIFYSMRIITRPC